jgi:hypothetical protein
MNYRMTQEFKPPFRVFPHVEEAGPFKVRRCRPGCSFPEEIARVRACHVCLVMTWGCLEKFVVRSLSGPALELSCAQPPRSPYRPSKLRITRYGFNHRLKLQAFRPIITCIWSLEAIWQETRKLRTVRSISISGPIGWAENKRRCMMTCFSLSGSSSPDSD